MVAYCPKCSKRVQAHQRQPQTRQDALKTGILDLIHFTDNGDHWFTMDLPDEHEDRLRILDNL